LNRLGSKYNPSTLGEINVIEYKTKAIGEKEYQLRIATLAEILYEYFSHGDSQPRVSPSTSLTTLVGSKQETERTLPCTK
jgi:hypothetical protein